MGKALDLTGQIFGRLTVLEKAGSLPVGKKGGKQVMWYCECTCGTWTLTSTGHLRRGAVTSCGCYKAERIAEFNSSLEMRINNTRHGGLKDGKRSSEYSTWVKMKSTLPYVEEWEDFRQFFKDMGWRPGDKYQLSRHDKRQPHGPNNTYWRDPNAEQQQRRNRSVADECCLDMSGISDSIFSAATPDEERTRETAGIY